MDKIMYYRHKLKTPQPDCYLGNQYQGHDVVPLSHMIYDKYSIRVKHQTDTQNKTSNTRNMKHLWMLFCRKNPGIQSIQRTTKKGYFFAYFTNTSDLDLFLGEHGNQVTEIQGVHDFNHAQMVSDYSISYDQRKPYFGKYDAKIEFYAYVAAWKKHAQLKQSYHTTEFYQQLFGLIDQMEDYKINLRYMTFARYDFVVYTNRKSWQEVHPFIKLSLGTDDNLRLYTTYTTKL